MVVSETEEEKVVGWPGARRLVSIVLMLDFMLADPVVHSHEFVFLLG